MLPSQQRAIDVAHCAVVRKALSKQWWCDGPTDSNSVLHTYGFDSGSKLQTLKRLQYLPRLLNDSPPELRALVQCNSAYSDSWSAEVIRNLEWLRCECPSFENCPTPEANVAYWESFIVSDPKAWRITLKRFAKSIEGVDCASLEPPGETCCTSVLYVAMCFRVRRV